MKLETLIRDMDTVSIKGKTDVAIDDMGYDSRKAGKGTLFFCLQGPRSDGHDYAAKAERSGAAAIVMERPVPDLAGRAVQILVADVREALSHIAARYYGNPSGRMEIIGVTGTNGKTSTTYLTKSILEAWGKKVGLIGTITNLIGDQKIPGHNTTPEADELQKLFRDMADHSVDNVVMEVSSHSLALKRVDDCHFAVGVFTNLTQDHLDFHGTMEGYREAKARLFTMCDNAIINIDDPTGRYFADIATGKVLTYGIVEEADILADEVFIDATGATFTMVFPGDTAVPIRLKTPGRFSVYNALAAGAACYSLGATPDVIQAGLNGVEPIHGRFEVIPTDTDYTVILDYAHTPDGLENILKTARTFVIGRLILLFGCGGDRDHDKRPKMGRIAGEYADLCVVTSDNPRSEEPMDIIGQILGGLMPTDCPYEVIENRREAIRYVLTHAGKDDVVILAGKGHETYQELKGGTIHFDEKEIVADILKEEGR